MTQSNTALLISIANCELEAMVLKAKFDHLGFSDEEHIEEQIFCFELGGWLAKQMKRSDLNDRMLRYVGDLFGIMTTMPSSEWFVKTFNVAMSQE